jgi:hypothetical protein
MKKVIFFLLFASGFSYHATAQQKPKTNYMVITISELNGVPVGKPLPNMIVTRTDSVQELKYLNLSPKVKPTDVLPAHENIILQALKPYFDKGWKLISTSIEIPIVQGTYYVENYRYYLSKDDQ